MSNTVVDCEELNELLTAPEHDIVLKGVSMVSFEHGISVIIPTYNRASKIGITLQSFIEQDYPQDRYEIVVVDNHSTDETREVIDSYIEKAPIPITYVFEERQGVHYARNRAVEVARFPLLYYTDDDMRADKDLLTEISKPLCVDPEIGTITGRVLPDWEVTPPKWISKYCYNALLSLNDRSEDLIISPSDVGVYSCHQAITKRALIDAGGFNPENTAGVWIGDGETGLNIKLRRLGYKFAYIGSAVTYHMIPAYRMTQRYLNQRLGNQGFCDSYTEYRSNPSSDFSLLLTLLKRTLITCPRTALLYLARSILGLNARWRFALAYLFYYYNRAVYDLKIVTDEEWKALVLRSDWLD